MKALKQLFLTMDALNGSHCKGLKKSFHLDSDQHRHQNFNIAKGMRIYHDGKYRPGGGHIKPILKRSRRF
jgi:hypothetical protein